MADPLNAEAISRWLEDALAHDGTHGLGDVQQALAEGRAQLFACATGACVTEVVITPRKKYLRVWLAGGDMDGMRELHPQVIAYARSQGCTSVVMHGRKGWERSFLTREEGWRPALVTFEREI